MNLLILMYTAARLAAVSAWLAAALVFALSLFGFGDVWSGFASLCCLLCAVWGAWRLRVWRQVCGRADSLLQRWLWGDFPALLCWGALAVLLCAAGLWRVVGEGLPIFDGWLLR